MHGPLGATLQLQQNLLKAGKESPVPATSAATANQTDQKVAFGAAWDLYFFVPGKY